MCSMRRLPPTCRRSNLPPAPGRMHPDPRDVVRACRCACHRRKRPLILGGRGAVISDAEAALVALADRVGALLATSVCGHGLFSGNPWSVGISGGFSSPIADELISESDFILAFGASLTQWTTKKGKLIAPGAVVAQVDIEVPKLGYQMPVQIAVHADAKATAEAVLAELARRSVPSAGRRDRTRSASASAQAITIIIRGRMNRAEASSIRARSAKRLMPFCRQIVSWRRTQAISAAGCRAILRVPNARGSCLSHSFQSVGLGLPSAIGLALANPGKLAVLGTGDGGFLMSIADLETAIRLGLRLCILVYNDASYAAEVHYFRRQGFSVDIVQFPDTDFAAIARGHGARGVTVRTLADLDPVKRGSPKARRACS